MVAVKNAPGIYRRDGKYVVKWWTPDGSGGGSRGQETLPEGTTLREAKEFKADKEREKKKPRHRKFTCDGWVEFWLEEYKRPTESTNINNAERVSKFAKDFAGRPLASVDRAEARLWYNRNKGRFKAVRAMLNDAVADGYISENPFLAVKNDEAERGRHDIVVLTEAEVTRLIEIARDLHGEYGAVVAGLIGTAAWTGARPGELFALERDDVDLVNKELYLTEALSANKKRKDPKWNSKRKIALLPQAEEILRSVPPHPFSETLFWTQRGKAYSPRSFHYYWHPVRTAFWLELPAARKAQTKEEAVRDRKIEPGFDFYELRHHFASYLANVLHATSREIAKQMGHKDGGRLAERLYVHTEDDDANASILERAKRVAEDRERQRAAV